MGNTNREEISMTTYRIIRLALLCAMVTLMGVSPMAQENKRGHDAKDRPEDRSKDCVDSQSLPDRGLNVPHDREPIVIKRVEPIYPQIAKSAGLTGTVLVAALVDRCGKVRDVAVEKSCGTNALDDAAVAAVRQWRFRPGEDHGRPVALWVTKPITFKLP
jgi:TonB family protein